MRSWHTLTSSLRPPSPASFWSKYSKPYGEGPGDLQPHFQVSVLDYILYKWSKTWSQESPGMRLGNLQREIEIHSRDATYSISDSHKGHKLWKIQTLHSAHQPQRYHYFMACKLAHYTYSLHVKADQGGEGMPLELKHYTYINSWSRYSHFRSNNNCIMQ